MQCRRPLSATELCRRLARGELTDDLARVRRDLAYLFDHGTVTRVEVQGRVSGWYVPGHYHEPEFPTQAEVEIP